METLLTDIRASLVAVVASIDAYAANPPAPAPVPAPAPAPQAFVTVPVVYQLFGPVQDNGSLAQVPGPGDFNFQGQALTASTKRIDLGSHVPDVHVARAIVVWTPNSAQNEIEIVQLDSGPANIQRMGLIVGEDVSTPRVGGVFLTDQMQQMVEAARASNTTHKHIGFRIKGPTLYTLYEVRLEVVWKLPKGSV